MFGSNMIVIPLYGDTAYIVTRHLKKENTDKGRMQHVKEHLLKVNPTAVTVQAGKSLLLSASFAIPIFLGETVGFLAVKG